MAKTNKFANEGYTLYILGKHIEITDAIRNYVWEKLSRIERIADHIIDVHVVLDAQKLEKTCSILMNFIRFQIKVQVGKDNMYEAIDKAIDRVVGLVRRYKTKLQSYRNKDLTTVDIHVNVIQSLKDDLKAINDDIEAESAKQEEEKYKLHQVVAKETMPLKTLTQDEAIMKMEITSDPFLIFKSEEDHKIKVIYRREDSNYDSSKFSRCLIRKRWVAATPEESVRQGLIQKMIGELGYPKGLISVEKKIGHRRFDLVCYTNSAAPLLLVECKAGELSEAAENQAFGYNAAIKAPFICLACPTAIKTLWQEQGRIGSVPFLPKYAELYAFSQRI